jgi:hypothetical protein
MASYVSPTSEPRCILPFIAGQDELTHVIGIQRLGQFLQGSFGELGECRKSKSKDRSLRQLLHLFGWRAIFVSQQ